MASFRETYKKLRAQIAFGSSVRMQEQTKGLHGRFFVKAFEGGKLVHEYVSDNVIVNSASILVARLLKDSTEPAGGITYLAVGTGHSGWNTQNPPAPTVSQSSLEAELARKHISSSHTNFVDPSTGDPINTPTNVVDFAVTFSESDAVGPIVEMSLFGGDATDAINSGTMVNYRTFPVINKTNSMTLSIIFRITA
jgi:hypothetical protein